MSVELYKKQSILIQLKYIDFVKETVCSYYNQPISVLSIIKKSRNSTNLRNIVIYLLWKYSQLSKNDLKNILKLTVSSINNAIHSVQNNADYDKDFRKELEIIRDKIVIEGTAESIGLDLSNFFYVNLSNITVLKINQSKSIILKGFREEEIKSIQGNLPKDTIRRDIKGSGINIIEKNT